MAVMEGMPAPAETGNNTNQASWAISVNSEEHGILDEPLFSTPDAKLADPSTCFDSWAGRENPESGEQNEMNSSAEHNETWVQNPLSFESGGFGMGEACAELGPLRLATYPHAVPFPNADEQGSSARAILCPPEMKSKKTPKQATSRKTADKGKSSRRSNSQHTEQIEPSIPRTWIPAGYVPSQYVHSLPYHIHQVPYVPEVVNSRAVNPPMRLWGEPVPPVQPGSERRLSESDQESAANGRGAHVRGRPEMQKNARDGQKHWARKVQEMRREWIAGRIWEHHTQFRQQIAMCKRCHIKSQHECLLRQLQAAYANGLLASATFSENAEDSFLGWVSFKVDPMRSQEFRMRIEKMFPGSPTKNTVNNVLRRAGLLPEHSWSGAWLGESTFNHSENHRTETPRASGASEAEDGAAATDFAGQLAAIAAGAASARSPPDNEVNQHRQTPSPTVFSADDQSPTADMLLALTGTPADGLQ